MTKTNINYISQLQDSFNELENTLIKKINYINNASKKVIGAAQYEEALGVLTLEKSELEKQLEKKQNECEKWQMIISEIVTKLNAVIDTMKSILNKEETQ